MMKEVNIFVASSIVEFEQERKDLSVFLEMLNDIYKQSDIHLKWNRPEIMSHSLVCGGSQTAYNQKITESEFFFLLIGKSLGIHTVKEFDLALETFERTGHPKIFPYFYMKPNVFPSDEVVIFRNRLREELGDYPDIISDFEKIKQIIHIELARYGAFQVKTSEPMEEEALMDCAINGIMQRIQQYQSEINGLERLDTSPRNIAEITMKYEEIFRLVKKYKLDPSVLLDYLTFLWKQRIYEAAISMGHWMESIYCLSETDKATWAILKHRLGVCCHESNRYTEGEKYYREELNIRRSLAIFDPLTERDLAITCNNLANLLLDTNQLEEARKYNQEALSILKHLYKKQPNAYRSNLAITYNNLGNLLRVENEATESEICYKTALTLFREEPPSKDNSANIVVVYNNIGVLLSDSLNYDEANSYFRLAIESCSPLLDENPVAYQPNIAMIYHNMGNVLAAVGKFREAENYYNKALIIRREYGKRDPRAYEIDISSTCNNLGVLYFLEGKAKESFQYHLEALKLRRKIVQDNPYANQPYVAESCYNLGLLERSLGHQTAAANYFYEALSIYKIYSYCQSDVQRVTDMLAHDDINYSASVAYAFRSLEVAPFSDL